MKYLLLFLVSFFSFSQQKVAVDFIKLKAEVAPNEVDKSISGNCLFEFRVKKTVDTIAIDAINMQFSDVKINGQSVNYLNTGKQLKLFVGFKKGKNQLSFSYFATPKQTLYFVKIGDETQIWTQGQGKYTSHWLPSFDDVNEKLVFSISVKYNYSSNLYYRPVVVSNGVLISSSYKIAIDGKTNIVQNNFEMKKPMSSYLVMLAIGNFNKKSSSSNSGIVLENYYIPDCEDKYEYTYKSSDAIFNFLEKEIGFNYPWEIYRQIPVRDFLYGGMENTTSTIFAQDYFVDESGFNDRNYINVNAHELAHQWFGDVVTAKEGKHHWLQEGFATYFALLAEREVFGDDYFYNALYHNSLQLRNASKTDSIPILNAKASSLTFYQKGAWALHSIKESIGDKKFKKVVKNYLKKYKFKNVETTDFLNEVAKLTDFDIYKFQKQWLENPKFPTTEATILLNKNKFMQQLFEVQKFKNLPQEERMNLFLKFLKSDCYYPIKVEIVNQLRSVSFEDKKELLLAAMHTNDVKVRLAVAYSFIKIPIDFQTEYETLLLDKSNNCKEIALLKLYESFPEKQDYYLNIASKWVGNNDKNLRILFLFLLEKSNKQTVETTSELLKYSSNNYESSVRLNAFEYALQLDTIDSELLKNLVNATQHFKWQVNGFARNTIRKLIKNEEVKLRFLNLLPSLPQAEQNQLQKLLDEK